MSPEPTPAARRATVRVAIAFGVTATAGVGLAATYALGGQSQLEGVLLALALAGLGYGFVVVAKRLLPPGPEVEERESFVPDPGEVEAFESDLERGEAWMERRGFLLKMLGLAAGALGLAALFPIRSLGPRPGRSLFRTAWGTDTRLVDDSGTPVGIDALEVGGVLTVFPEGAVGRDDSQVLLVRVEAAQLRVRPGREAWSPGGYVAYSKVCTHAGCPVGLYQQDIHELLCPCHQSTFDVLDGARPIFGPATRSLPQLPLRVDDQGILRSRRDFTEPIGPGFWNRGRGS